MSEDAAALRELREGAERLKAILDTAVEAIITIDERGRIESANPATERLFGFSAAEMIGQNVNMLMPSPDRERHGSYLANYLRTGEAKIIGIGREVMCKRRDGSLFPADLSVSEVQLADRRIFTGILRDVTERTRAAQALEIRTRLQQAVSDLSQHALAGRALDRLMNDAVVLVAQILGIEFCKVLELTPAGDELALRAGVGWREGLVGAARVGAGRESQGGFTLIADGPVIVEDLANEERFHGPALLIEHGVVSGVSVVIRGRSRSFGVLGAHTTQRRVFSADDVHFIQSVADVLAAAIERRQLEEELLAATSREQRRIGQDLHDGLCQHLAGIEFRTEALTRDLAADPALQEEAAKIGALIRDGTRQARMLSRGLAPVEVEANGLISALTELAASGSHLYRIGCDFRCEEPVLLTEHMTATHLYHIAQEAISNAVRHGHAKSIAIELRQRGREAELTITSDGEPLPAEPFRSEGMGLRIMQYRAEMIGATLRIGSTGEGGTVVTCAFNTDR